MPPFWVTSSEPSEHTSTEFGPPPTCTCSCSPSSSVQTEMRLFQISTQMKRPSGRNAGPSAAPSPSASLSIFTSSLPSGSSLREVAVVDRERVARDLGRAVAREEDRGGDELVRLDQGLAQHAVLDEIRRRRRAARGEGVAQQLGVAETGGDGIDSHPSIDPLEREGARGLYDAALAREIGAGVRIGDESADRRDVDDAALALLEHLAADGLAHEVRAL